MNVRLDPRSEQLVQQQLREGRYHSAEEVVAHAIEAMAERESKVSESSARHQTVQDMLDFGAMHGFTLGRGLHVRDLIHEGHKY